MPVLETDFLKGLIDPKDHLHRSCERALSKVRTREWDVASSSFLELDLLLKNGGVSSEERATVFETLSAEIPQDAILGVTHVTISNAAQLQARHRDIRHFYFDSLHLSTALGIDGQIISTDRSFDHISQVRRIPLERI